jgi:hypothetical protein
MNKIFSNEDQAEILLTRIIDNAKKELEKLEKIEHIDIDNLVINIGKLIDIAAKLEQ